MSQLGFLVNTDNCVACKSCVLACKEKHNIQLGRKFRKLHSMSAGSWDTIDMGNNRKAYNPNAVFSYSLSISCNHCAEPACMDICPAQAIGKRKDGIVYIDRELCIGCLSCQSACPYGAPSFDAEAMKMEKCDMCRELQAVGETPACVASCMMNAIEYGDMETLRLKYPNAIQQVAPIDGPEATKPSLLIIPHRKYTTGTEMVETSFQEELQSNE